MTKGKRSCTVVTPDNFESEIGIEPRKSFFYILDNRFQIWNKEYYLVDSNDENAVVPKGKFSKIRAGKKYKLIYGSPNPQDKIPRAVRPEQSSGLVFKSTSRSKSEPMTIVTNTTHTEV